MIWFSRIVVVKVKFDLHDIFAEDSLDMFALFAGNRERCGSLKGHIYGNLVHFPRV